MEEMIIMILKFPFFSSFNCKVHNAKIKNKKNISWEMVNQEES